MPFFYALSKVLATLLHWGIILVLLLLGPGGWALLIWTVRRDEDPQRRQERRAHTAHRKRLRRYPAP